MTMYIESRDHNPLATKTCLQDLSTKCEAFASELIENHELCLRYYMRSVGPFSDHTIACYPL